MKTVTLGALQSASAMLDRLADFDDHIVAFDLIHRVGFFLTAGVAYDGDRFGVLLDEFTKNE